MFLEETLDELVPEVRWEVLNQATGNSYSSDAPLYRSILDAMSRWADLVTAVGAYLTDHDQIKVVVLAGLDDLFDLSVRPNLATPTAPQVYQRRITTKGWTRKCPKLTIEELEIEATARRKEIRDSGQH